MLLATDTMISEQTLASKEHKYTSSGKLNTQNKIITILVTHKGKDRNRAHGNNKKCITENVKKI